MRLVRHARIAVAKFPIRLLGLVLLTLAISIASCQALFNGALVPPMPQAAEHADR
jgi:hypothetical protein